MSNEEENVNNDKLRTPSGNTYENSVKERRTIFSPPEEIQEGSENKCSQTVKSDGLKTIQAWLFHSGKAQSKQTVNKHGKHVKSLKEGESDESGSDNNFATPPTTPARIKKIKVSKKKVLSKEKRSVKQPEKAEKNLTSKLDKFLRMAQQASGSQLHDKSEEQQQLKQRSCW